MADAEKHTPGPYDVFVGNANGRGLIRIETAHDAPEPGVIIATTTRGPQSEANATLLAASFDMLEALKAVRANLVRLAWDENSVMIEGIDAAIAKATLS